MAKFLEHDSLKKEIFHLFEEIDEELFIVSPYIKLDKKLRSILERKMFDENFVLQILCGKNEDDVSKSLCSEDFLFFKQFKNVFVHYHPDLHAKYYANDTKSIVTSLNLHEFSIKNNIETGVLFKRNYRGQDNKNDDSAYEYFQEIFEDSRRIYVKTTRSEKRFFGLIKTAPYTNIEIDQSASIYGDPNNESHMQFNSPVPKRKTGYCIRSGKEITFDINRPFCKEEYEKWAKFRNPNHPENFCHYSGKKSFGKTTINKPVLREYYNEAIKSMRDNH